ncbi:amidohydrolase family protein [Natrialbaceae archaeon A-CW2]|uniref:amidohydrolase family protein n=1 Tax=Natronosalvus amylolyticus TaxID=2961994 RepID=UPI0020C96072|nr:amidohydrolase family protein [Natronosalvus amylolyticus]
MTIETNHAAWRRENPVIDMHTHIGVDYLDDAVRFMDQNGLEMMVDISAHTGESFETLIEGFSEYPDRFAAFSGINFEDLGEDGWIERELERMEEAVEAGAVGFKIHKRMGMVYTDPDGDIVPVDDERLAPIFEKAADLDVVVAFHIADPKAFFRPLTPENERYEELSENPDWWWGDREKHPYGWWELIRQLEKVISRHPETKFLGVHFGCAAEEVEYVADVMRDNPNYIIDVSARLGEMGRHDPERVRDIFLEFQDRILFGTDLGVRESVMLGSPQGFDPTDEDVEEFYDAHWHYFETDEAEIAHPTPIQGDWTVDAIDLPRDVLEKFYFENARKHLKL